MVEKIISEVQAEAARAIEMYPPFNSFHEGYAVLLEECDELWAEVMKKQVLPSTPVEKINAQPHRYQDKEKIRAECIQVAAMAIRIIADLCPEVEVSRDNK